MRFLVDAQLPRRFCGWLVEAGHEARHTLDLARGNRTSDQEILAVAEQDQSIVVTKDDDFVQAFLIQGQPKKLLLISTGNISNNALETLVRKHIQEIVVALESASFIELGRASLVVHE
jgi:predicted nuclease of predicted toxin-antitoxin system